MLRLKPLFLLQKGGPMNTTYSKRLARYSDGPTLYSISATTFRRTAIAAHAIVKLNQTARVDLIIFDEYLKTQRDKTTSASAYLKEKVDSNKKNELTKSKKLISIKEGALIYSMSESKFRREASNANAVVKVGALTRVHTDLFENYLKESRITDPTYYRIS